MDPKGICVVAPTGTLGYGFSASDLARVLEEEHPDAIAVDAGSTDPGPYYLGAGVSFTNRMEIREELDILIEAALRYRIPLIVGSCGGAGAEPHLRWVENIVLELAAERGWKFMLATISADVTADVVEAHRVSGDTTPLDHDKPLTSADVQAATRIVAQMGYEPIVEALRQGGEIILVGRCCDDAMMAAYPIYRGADPALSLHMGKILECGALASEPIGMDVLVGRVNDSHFDLVPGALRRSCTPKSVASHSLYEREDPVFQLGPGGALDLSGVKVEAISARVARVAGARYVPSTDYFVKLEGVRRVGARAIAIAGIRCPSMIARIDELLGETRRRVDRSLSEHGGWPDGAQLHVHVYGRDGVMGKLERRPLKTHELGVVIEAVADTPELAKTLCHRYAGTLLHLDFEGQFNNAGNLAFLYSPAEIDAGDVYEFSIYHLMRVDDPLELFPIKLTHVGSEKGVEDAIKAAA
jgi:hypothetical protein